MSPFSKPLLLTSFQLMERTKEHGTARVRALGSGMEVPLSAPFGLHCVKNNPKALHTEGHAAWHPCASVGETGPLLTLVLLA